jgi:hypothetical protein
MFCLSSKKNTPQLYTIFFFYMFNLMKWYSTIADEGTDEVDGSGGGRRELDEGSSEVNVAGLCINSPCDADPNRMCFCCTRLANEPCYDTLKQCVSACPNCNFLVCPPPAAWRTRRLGSPPASPA